MGEKLPAQLLQLLRSDSMGVIEHRSANPAISFTGMPGYTYLIEKSSDLVNWSTISTNRCRKDGFEFTDPAFGKTSKSFYRSVLMDPNREVRFEPD